jgi:hypothetical protein
MSNENAHASTTETITLSQRLERSVFARPEVIKFRDRTAYVDWWKQTLWFKERIGFVRIHSRDDMDAKPTAQWDRGHGRYPHKRYTAPWRLSTSGESSFRQNGYAKKDVRHSINREEKTKDFRANKAGRGWHRGGSAKTYWKRQDNRDDRREVAQQCREYAAETRGCNVEGIDSHPRDWSDPVDSWKWD